MKYADVVSIIRELAKGGDLDAITDAIERHAKTREISKADRAAHLAYKVFGILSNTYLPTDAAWVKASMTLCEIEPHWEAGIAVAARYGGLREVVDRFRDAVSASLLSDPTSSVGSAR